MKVLQLLFIHDVILVKYKHVYGCSIFVFAIKPFLLNSNILFISAYLLQRKDMYGRAVQDSCGGAATGCSCICAARMRHKDPIRHTDVPDGDA